MIFRFFSKLGVGKDDLRFFFPLATIAGILMESLSWLPERINRDYFSSIIYDHLPLNTIGTIFFIQIIFGLIYHSVKIKSLKIYIHDIVEHTSIKIGHFCSPAFSVLFGLSLACTVFSIISFDSKYLKYSYSFGSFSLCFLVISRFSYSLNKFIIANHDKVLIDLFRVLGFSMVIVVLIMLFLNENPIKIEYKLSLAEYDLVKVAAGDEPISVFSKKATIDSALAHKHSENIE